MLGGLRIAVLLAALLATAQAAKADAWRLCRGANLDRAIAACTTIIEHGTQSERLKAYKLRGDVYKGKGDQDHAIADFDELVRLIPKNDPASLGEVFHSRGDAYDRKGDSNRAIADLDQAVRLNPQDAASYKLRASIYREKGANERALADFDQAFQLNPQDSEAIHHRGFIYDNKGDYDRAIADYDQAIRLDPRYSDAYLDRGAAYQAKGNNDRALSDYDQAIALKPQAPFAYRYRGLAYEKKGDHDRAISDYDQAIRLEPSYADAYYDRGLAFEKKGEPAKARADFVKLLEINRDNADAKTALARIDKKLADATSSGQGALDAKTLCGGKDPDRKIAGCTTVIERGTPADRSRAYYLRGYAYKQKGDYNRAIADLDESIRLDPKNATAYTGRAFAYERKGDHDRALADLDEAIRLDPKDAYAYVGRGAVNEHKGDVDRAIVELDQAIRLDPKQPDAHRIRGYCYQKKGDLDRAIADFDHAVLVDPKDAVAYYNRGLAYDSKRDFDRALADYDEAIRLNAKDADSYGSRARIYENKGDLTQARTGFLKYLELKPGNATGKDALARIDRKIAGLAASSPLAAQPRPSAVAKLPAGPVPALKFVTDKRVALVIGNSRYATASPLPNPVRDSAAVAEELRGAGFTVTVLNDAKRSQMIAALRTFRDDADNSDWAVVFFAGHGMEMGGKNYLVPTDAHLGSDRDIDEEAVPLARVESAIEGAHHLRLVILDACRNNPFLARMVRTASVTRSVERGFARVEPHPGTLVVFAAKEGETADDGDGAHSPFTTALLAQMRKPGLEVRRLFDYVRDDVLEATKNRQMPFSYGSLPARRDFFFVSASNEKP